MALPIEGRDSTGAVRIVVDSRGIVQQVHIDDRWADRFAVSGLGDALFDAYDHASLNAFKAAAAARYGPERDRRERADAPAQATSEQSTTDGNHVRTESFRDWLDRVDTALDDLERLRAAAARQPADEERTVVSPGRVVEISQQGLKITKIVVNGLAATIPSRRIALEALSAFQAALRP